MLHCFPHHLPIPFSINISFLGHASIELTNLTEFLPSVATVSFTMLEGLDLCNLTSTTLSSRTGISTLCSIRGGLKGLCVISDKMIVTQTLMFGLAITLWHMWVHTCSLAFISWLFIPHLIQICVDLLALPLQAWEGLRWLQLCNFFNSRNKVPSLYITHVLLKLTFLGSWPHQHPWY